LLLLDDDDFDVDDVIIFHSVDMNEVPVFGTCSHRNNSNNRSVDGGGDGGDD
jgi:hypothetical protein